MRTSLINSCAMAVCLLGVGVTGNAQTMVTVDPGANWLGYMNVSELPANGGAFAFGSGWGTADLVATFNGPVLTLSPNTIGDANEYWYIGGGKPGAAGNKIMEANMYVELNGGLGGQTLTFAGTVLSNTFTSAHQTLAFIKDYAPNYSSFNVSTAPLDATGNFSLSLATIDDAARHVQYGFMTTGVNVWVTDVAPYGNLQVTAVPEPTSLAGATLACAALLGLRLRGKVRRNRSPEA